MEKGFYGINYFLIFTTRGQLYRINFCIFLVKTFEKKRKLRKINEFNMLTCGSPFFFLSILNGKSHLLGGDKDNPKRFNHCE